ncbi:MAG TPA: hypothetical protein VFN68_06725 [Acidimicrobiales bacterium]|nr:hypothetical protein [Acidimicrobiales bacterium]
MGIVYVAVGFMVIPALLFVFHRLSRGTEVTSQPPAGPGSGLADEAERWLRTQG